VGTFCRKVAVGSPQCDRMGGREQHCGCKWGADNNVLGWKRMRGDVLTRLLSIGGELRTCDQPKGKGGETKEKKDMKVYRVREKNWPTGKC